jgi:demethylmenaquinone methyltransferase / 2-methoxy-6-polyprenyl-1,4-benzoquinol methylase
LTGTARQESSLPGTRPEGSPDEHEAATRVREIFTRIVPRYDFLNHFLSFSMDRIWRRRTAGRFVHILRRPEAQVLDVCCGTGDLAFALDRARQRHFCNAKGNGTPIFGGDFVVPMLERARQKAARANREVVFAAADTMSLPYADRTFDLVTTAFGFRNLVSYRDGLREIVRVLKPGGEAGILEFSEPQGGGMGTLFRLYFERILPRVGGAISGSREAYSYLPSSVAKFPSPSQLSELMRECGFAQVAFEAWNFGSVILHTGRRAD